MKRSFQKHVCFVVFFQFLAWYTSFAGYPVSAYLGIDQGLSNNFVRCIYQDKNGFMWFGTYDGLNRYDGYEFKIFRNNFKNNRSLINSWINAISEDAKGNLWIGTRQVACVYQGLSNNFSPLYYYTSAKKKRNLIQPSTILKQMDWAICLLEQQVRAYSFFQKVKALHIKYHWKTMRMLLTMSDR